MVYININMKYIFLIKYSHFRKGGLTMILTEKEKYIILRKRKKIRIVNIAKEIGCCHSLISKYENGVADMSNDKIFKYRSIIVKNEYK